MQCNRRPDARAIIKSRESYLNARGEVLFYRERDGVLITAKISGLPQNGSGFYGFHIHEGNSCDGEGFPGIMIRRTCPIRPTRAICRRYYPITGTLTWRSRQIVSDCATSSAEQLSSTAERTTSAPSRRATREKRSPAA